MYKQIILIILILFIFFKLYKEHFSNSYQDTEIRAKLSHFGSNLSPKKPLLTLYYDRREPNCKYFYDYFSTHHGGLDKSILDENQKLRFQDDRPRQFTGTSQPWNQLKAIYSGVSDIENKFIKPNFLKIEEIEVEDGHLYDFNNKPAFKIKDEVPNIGYVEYQGEKPKEYKQYYKPKDFLKRIPFVTLSFFKHKSKKDIEDLIKIMNENGDDKDYSHLKDFEKYEYYVIEYDGVYSPNNRHVKTTLNNLIKFINDTFEEYLEVDEITSHYSRIGNDTIPVPLKHQIGSTGKCNKCSEFFKV
jgi:hypothetical protein